MTKSLVRLWSNWNTYRWLEVQKWTSTLENIFFSFLNNLNIILLYDPAFHSYIFTQKKWKYISTHTKKQVPEYYSSKIHNSQKWNNLIFHQYIRGWIKCVVYFNGILLSHKQKPKITDEHNLISKSCSMKDTRYKIVQINAN